MFFSFAQSLSVLAITFILWGYADSACLAKKPKDSELAKEANNQEKVEGHGWVKGRIVIQAPTNTVWYSVHEERKSDPDMAYSKILEQRDNETTLEQKFVLIPMLGTSTCLMKQKEIPLQRIDYKLVKSDHFKAMEGSWILTPGSDGKSTELELFSYIDLGLPIPHFIVNATLSKKIERRLRHVKSMAEHLHKDVAQKSIVPVKQTH